MASPAEAAAQLAEPATRDGALAALENHDGPHAADLALATAPSLGTLLVADAAEVDAATSQRVGLLIARMVLEAGGEKARLAVYGAAFADGRLVGWYGSTRAAFVRPLLEKPAEALDREDALCYACARAAMTAGVQGPKGWTGANQAAGLTDPEWIGNAMTSPLLGKKHLPTDEMPLKLVTLLMELAKAPEQLSAWVLPGVWQLVADSVMTRIAVGKVLFELGLVELAVAQLHALGTAAERLSTPGAGVIMQVAMQITLGQPTETQQAITSSWMSSGFFDECIATMAAFEQRGVEQLPNAHSELVYFALSTLEKCTKVPGCEAKIRGVASALAFAQDNSLDFMTGLGYTTGSTATSLICTIWGREEAGAEFTFTQAHVDTL